MGDREAAGKVAARLSPTWPATGYEVDDDQLGELAASVHCEIDEVLGKGRTWARLDPATPAAHGLP